MHINDGGLVGVEEVAVAFRDGEVGSAFAVLGAPEEGGGGGGGGEGGGARGGGRGGQPFFAAVVEAEEVEAHVDGGVVAVVDVHGWGSQEVFGQEASEPEVEDDQHAPHRQDEERCRPYDICSDGYNQRGVPEGGDVSFFVNVTSRGAGEGFGGGGRGGLGLLLLLLRLLPERQGIAAFFRQGDVGGSYGCCGCSCPCREGRESLVGSTWGVGCK